MYKKYPENISASAEPIPAARKAYKGERVKPARSTMQSPKFMYPFKGDGIFIIMVATQQREDISAAITIFFVVLFIF